MDLKSTQLKDTYGNLLTIGTTAGSPTTGTLENGDGEDITSLTIAGDINVTGTVTADGVQSTDGDIKVTTLGSFVGFNSQRATVPSSGGFQLGRLNFDAYSTGTTFVSGASIQSYSDSAAWTSSSTPAYLSFQTTPSGSTSLKERIKVASNGDISFYDDTGVTPAFFWDASAESLGIGTTSPYAPLTVDTANGILNIANGNTSGGTKIQAWGATPSSDGYLAIEGYTKEYMRIDSSGNVGLGVTPSASNASTSFEMANGSTLFARTVSPQFGLMVNAVGNWYEATYKTSAAANMYLLASGQHQWYNAPSGTAGDAITFTQAMTLDPSGNLLVGKTASSGIATGNIEVSNSSSASVQIEGGTHEWSMYVSASTDALRFYEDSTERMRIDSSGNVGIGVSPSALLSAGNVAVDVGNSNGGEFVARRSGGQANLAMGVTGGDVGYLYSTTNTPMVFGTNNAERMRILSGGGITFNGDTATANALDDYEEGTWTPSFSGSGYVFANQSGTYTKIGRMVFVRCKFEITTVGTNTSSINFSGLPFTANNSIASGHFIGVVREVQTNGAMFVAQVTANSSSGGVNSMDGVTSGDNYIFTTDIYNMSVTYEV